MFLLGELIFNVLEISRTSKNVRYHRAVFVVSWQSKPEYSTGCRLSIIIRRVTIMIYYLPNKNIRSDHPFSYLSQAEEIELPQDM